MPPFNWVAQISKKLAYASKIQVAFLVRLTISTTPRKGARAMLKSLVLAVSLLASTAAVAADKSASDYCYAKFPSAGMIEQRAACVWDRIGGNGPLTPARAPARDPVDAQIAQINRLGNQLFPWASQSAQRTQWISQQIGDLLSSPVESQLDRHGCYRNVDGDCVHVPSRSTTGLVPVGATAQCRDGAYSFSRHTNGTCSGHGGVRTWL
jgi:hypothetical protein